jgi:hypothetical protein
MNWPLLIPTAKTRGATSPLLPKRRRGAGGEEDNCSIFLHTPPALSKSIKHVSSVALISIGLNVRTLTLLFYLGVVMTWSQTVLGVASITQVAYTNRAVAPESGWPEGTLALINDPARTVGWNPWFSELPNDVNYYAFEPRSMDDVNRLVARLAGIKGTTVHLRLNPDAEAARIGYTGDFKWPSNTAAVLAIGNQATLDHWFQRQSETRPGVRKFGLSELSKPPMALPPTLTLYTGQPVVNLQTLQVPKGVTLAADIPEGVRKMNDPNLKAILDFVAKWNAFLDSQRSGDK